MAEIEVTGRKITRVRIEFADGTYSELDTPEECRLWHEAVVETATNAFLHGYQSPKLNWKSGTITTTPTEIKGYRT